MEFLEEIKLGEWKNINIENKRKSASFFSEITFNVFGNHVSSSIQNIGHMSSFETSLKKSEKKGSLFSTVQNNIDDADKV